MPNWAFTLDTINAKTIVSGPVISAYFEVKNGPLTTRPFTPVSAPRIGQPDQAVRLQPKPTIWRVRVNLGGSFQQLDQATLHALFNEEDGLVYLRVKDGAGVLWRCAVQTQYVEAQTISQYDAVLFVPDPTWREDAPSSINNLAQSTSPLALAPTNNGDRKTSPLITFQNPVAESINCALNDFPYSFVTNWVNRAPNPLDPNSGGIGNVYLCDQSGAQARIATDTSAGGATILQTTGLTTLNGAVLIGDTSIIVTSAAGFNPNGGLAVIDAAGTKEQIIYTGITGNTLTGCTRGVGGTAAAAHNSGLNIQPSGVLNNGDDVRVWLDDVPNVERWLVNWGNAGAVTDIVINVAAPAGISLTARAAATVTAPAVGATLNFVEGNQKLPPAGFLMWGNEIFHYSAKAGSTGVVIDGRALWGSTAAAHAVNVLLWANPRHIVVGAGWANADSPPSSIDRRPCFQLPGSSNQTLKYGDESDDANTVFFDRTRPDRSASWKLGFDKDGNTVSPLMSIPVSTTSLTFKDDVPGDGSQPYNFAELPLVPQGIRSGSASAVTVDYNPAAEILNLELFTADSSGVYKLQDQLQQAAAALARQLPAALTNTAYKLKLKGRYNPIIGYRADARNVNLIISNASYGNVPANGAVGFKFTYVAGWQIDAIGAWMQKAVAGSQDVTCDLYTDVSAAPGVWSGSLGKNSVDASGKIYYWKMPRSRITMGATYWAVFQLTTTFNNVNWPGDQSIGTVASGSQFYGTDLVIPASKTAGVWAAFPDSTGYAYLTSAYDNVGTAAIGPGNPIRLSTTGLRTGTTANFDKPIVTLEPAQAVYAHRNTGFVTNGGAGALFHLNGTLASASDGNNIVIDKWMKQAAACTFAIDCDQKTCLYTEDGIVYPTMKALTSLTDSANWITMPPGVNSLSYTNPSLLAPGAVDILFSWRGAKT